MSKGFAAADERLASYVERVFRLERDSASEIGARARARGLPEIQVSLFDARHLELCARAIGATRAVEIGTLAGFSGLALVRGLGPDGRLDTFELDPGHAAVARETFERHGVAARVRVHVGPARERLRDIEADGPFDLVFIDADKEGYPAYLEWSAEHLRPGGIVLLDNAFAWGRVLDVDEPNEADADARAIHAANLRLGEGHPFRATMLPTADGLAMGVKVA